MRCLPLAALLLACTALAGGRPEEIEPADPAPDAPQEVPTNALVIGRHFTQQLYRQDIDGLWSKCGPQLRKQLGGLEGAVGFARKVKGDFGSELRIGAETVASRGGVTTYTRLSVFSLYARGVELVWSWDAAGVLVAASVQPASSEVASPHLATVAKTTLRLPFEGAWSVLWGGRSWEENHHAAVSDQRFALDLLIFKANTTFEGDGTHNEQYFCWGKPVVAPAEGRVVLLEDGVNDNTPGQVNPNKLYGNHLVLEHGNGEYSLLGHLMRGSLLVKQGERVKAGQPLGRAGNSGVSTEPHLHYQLMDAPEWLKANGIPPVFIDYTADGKPLARGEPKRFQQLSQGVR